MAHLEKYFLRTLLRQRIWYNYSKLALSFASKRSPFYASIRCKNDNINDLFKPIDIKPTASESDVGAEIVGQLTKKDVGKVLIDFFKRKETKKLALESGIDDRMFHETAASFKRFCIESKPLPVDLHIVVSDIIKGSAHVTDLFPFYRRHAQDMFPHLVCMDDLRRISDLREPAHWYPEARAMKRQVIFHAGPTNSGKTFQALQRFFQAESGVYCGPLRLLAREVYEKSNEQGAPCDLVTGDDRQFGRKDRTLSAHVACTVEMCSVQQKYQVAVIDEIQMIRDGQRGWAWARALLGLCAEEIHVCGEATAIELVKNLVSVTGDELDVRHYKRLTKLTFLDRAVESFDNVRPGDCIVCFNKSDIYNVSRTLEKKGREVAVVYGSLPAGTKLAQAKRFNDPADPCKVMVATDAIGMGLNLNIKRVVFYDIVKPQFNERGEREMDVLTTSQVLQIGGRAGRFGTEYEDGEVTTFKSSDIRLLKEISQKTVPGIERAGLRPTADQIELFAYHLPKHSLSSLMDIFVSLCQLDDGRYFMCNMDEFKFLADIIEHVPLPLRVRYVFCCAPISNKMAFVCGMFLKFARQVSRGEPVSVDWMMRQLGWPFATPETIADLVRLEEVFDVLDIYRWLGMRFIDMFPDIEAIKEMQRDLEVIIQNGVKNIVKLLKRVGSVAAADQRDLKENRIADKALATPSTDVIEKILDGKGQRGTDIDARTTALKKVFESFEDLNDDGKMNLVDSFKEAVNQKEKLQKVTRSMGSGRLLERLKAEGLLDDKMIEQLKRELKESSRSDDPKKDKRDKRRKK